MVDLMVGMVGGMLKTCKLRELTSFPSLKTGPPLVSKAQCSLLGEKFLGL